ncbi:MAG TPA: hypothetical protein VJ725_07320 [Thermoanaerobaculia bacterium]|nr:hypothetical protein [Thermoanaerobaculia bacterium]
MRERGTVFDDVADLESRLNRGRRVRNATLALLLVAEKAHQYKARAEAAEAQVEALLQRQDSMANQIELLRDQLRECG